MREVKEENGPDKTTILPINIEGQKGEKEEGNDPAAHTTPPGPSECPAVDA